MADTSTIKAHDIQSVVFCCIFTYLIVDSWDVRDAFYDHNVAYVARVIHNLVSLRIDLWNR